MKAKVFIQPNKTCSCLPVSLCYGFSHDYPKPDLFFLYPVWPVNQTHQLFALCCAPCYFPSLFCASTSRMRKGPRLLSPHAPTSPSTTTNLVPNPPYRKPKPSAELNPNILSWSLSCICTPAPAPNLSSSSPRGFETVPRCFCDAWDAKESGSLCLLYGA